MEHYKYKNINHYHFDNVKSVIDITDAMMIAMCVPNIIVLYILAPEVKKDLKAYCQKYKIAKLIERK